MTTTEIKYPDNPATSKQLWLLHLLTKEDTRNWKLTVKEASDKISELKSGTNKSKVMPDVKPDKRPLVNPHASARIQDKQKLAQIKYDKTHSVMLGNIAIIKAYKVISRHNWQGKTGFCISTEIFGIFPRGKNTYKLSWYKSYDDCVITPLQGHCKWEHIPYQAMEDFILSITDIHNAKHSPIPDDVLPIAIDKARELKTSIDIYHLIDGEYVRD